MNFSEKTWAYICIFYHFSTSGRQYHGNCWAPSQYPKRRLSVRSRKVSKPRDRYFKLSYRFAIWQAHRQHCCRSACQISERSDNYKYKSRGFETLRDLTERRLFGYWDGALMGWWRKEIGKLQQWCWTNLLSMLWSQHRKGLRPRQNGCNFADDIFKRIFFNECAWISIKKSQWILFLRTQLTIFQHWFRLWLGVTRLQWFQFLKMYLKRGIVWWISSSESTRSILSISSLY